MTRTITPTSRFPSENTVQQIASPRDGLAALGRAERLGKGRVGVRQLEKSECPFPDQGEQVRMPLNATKVVSSNDNLQGYRHQ